MAPDMNEQDYRALIMSISREMSREVSRGKGEDKIDYWDLLDVIFYMFGGVGESNGEDASDDGPNTHG
jgi:hypothetical protein